VRILVTGGAGFIGRLVAAGLAPGSAFLARLDRVWDGVEDGPRSRSLVGDVAAIGDLARADELRPDVIVHAAGITTAACEADPDAAFAINVESTRTLLAWCRGLPRPPRVLLTSSVAVFGGGEPYADELARPAPGSTYGATKLMAEALVLDAARRGIVEGLVVRLPVTIIRPGRVGQPGAGFLSDLIMAAAAGRPFIAPLAGNRAVPVASRRRTIEALVRLATGPLPSSPLVHMPSVAATARDALAALEREGVRDPGRTISFMPDPAVERLIAGWPAVLASREAGRLGLAPPDTIDAVVAGYLAGQRGEQRTLTGVDG
jgi:nucleoside-diphosphate-sugar epimerase